MYYHPHIDKSKENTIGLWKAGEEIVGLATYDLVCGEAFCEALPDYRELLPEMLPYSMPEGLRIRPLHFPEDNLVCQKVIWKGFGHEGDAAELDKMLRNSHRIPPHRDERLCLSVVDECEELVAHCTCWYDEKTDYAYIEPVCVIPAFRGVGLGRAVLSEALNRCKALGAARAIVLADFGFYRSLGFLPVQTYRQYYRA